MTKIRRYSELSKLQTFEQRFEYLRLNAAVGRPTFGFDRYINQAFYRSYEWKKVRDDVIVRDNGCDLGIIDRPVFSDILIHHINPMAPEDIIHKADWIIDPEFLITTTKETHNAIHYGRDLRLPKVVVERSPSDTKLW